MKLKLIIYLCLFFIINNCTHSEVKVQSLPGKSRADFRSARIYLTEGLNNYALDSFLKVHENAPCHVETLWIIGNIYYDSTDDLNDIIEIFQNLKLAFDYYTLVLVNINKISDWEVYTDHNRKYTFLHIKNDTEQQLESIYLKLYEIADSIYQDDVETAEFLFNELLKMYPEKTLPAWRLRLN